MKIILAAGLIAAGLAGCGYELPSGGDFTGSRVQSSEKSEPTRQQAMQKSIERKAP